MEKSCKKCNFVGASEYVCCERLKRGFPRDMCDIPDEVIADNIVWNKCPLLVVDSKIKTVPKTLYETADGKEFETFEEALDNDLFIELKQLFGMSDGEIQDMIILKKDLLEILLNHR